MSITRRKFLTHVASGCGCLALSQFALPRLLLAQSVRPANGRNLIFINLQGGVDGLTMLPYYEGPISGLINGTLRRTLRVAPENVIPIHSQGGEVNKIGLHPSFLQLFRAAGSNIKIIQKYGITLDPGRSHDTCQMIYSLGSTRIQPGTSRGFLARLMDSENWESHQFWAISGESRVDFNTTKKQPIVLSELASYDYNTLYAETELDALLASEVEQDLLSLQIPKSAIATTLQTTQKTMHETVAMVRGEIAAQQVGRNEMGNYSPQGIGASLRDTAKILKAKSSSDALGLRDKATVVYLSMGGFDSHSDQNNQDYDGNLGNLLLRLGNNLAVLVQDLKNLGIWQQTAIVLFSEFGRTCLENGRVFTSTVGTDHGWGSNSIVLGGAVQAGVMGEVPTESELTNPAVNALIPTTDFRDLFSDVVAWLGSDPTTVIADPGYSRQPLGLFS